MPINQAPDQLTRARNHMKWLSNHFTNAEQIHFDLSYVFRQLDDSLELNEFANELAAANTRSRLRMLTLYHIAQCKNSLVVGTGNRVEDFGVGFYTKYGDGGVDISPIADLYKSEVRALAAELGIDSEIVQAAPTDGLWTDGRTDEDQLGATYDELERVMQGVAPVTERDYQVIEIYNKHNQKNAHKMIPIPVCKIVR
jgi:NAD+ synthase